MSPTRVWMQRGAVVAVWLTALLLWRSYQTSNDLGTIDAAQRFIDDVDAVWWGPLAFLLASLVRPLVLFPASVLTIAAGVLFGPVTGVALVVIGANASALLAYAVGRLLGPAHGGTDVDPDGDPEHASLVARWGRRMRERSFETVFVMRLLFLPYDLVNYASGALRIRWTSFLLATVLGTLPGTISFVLLGSSLERIDMGLDGINPWAVAAGVAMFLISLVIARITRRREDRTAAPDPGLETSTWPPSTPTGPTELRSSVPAPAD